MAFSRHLGVIGILSVSWFVAVGCSDDDQNAVQGDGGEAGEGGEGPNGGKSTSGGSANNAGKGGNAAAGKGGTATAGSGGTPTGGTAGSATIGGAGAGAVGGEDAGGAGGAPDPGPGGAGAGGASAGAAGDGGAGGTPEPAVAKKCDFGCNVDADCNGVPGLGDCDDVLKRCRATDCTVTTDCAPLVSNWITPCANDSECTPDLERCVAWEGDGYCASLPDSQFPEFPCTFGSPTTMPLFGAVGEVEVCADLTQVCNAQGGCELGCASPLLGCGAGTGDTCNPTTGLCECAQSTECTKAGVSVCGGNGLCGCTDDTDCAKTAGATGLGKCVNGTCGCDSATTCVNPGFANATKICE